MTTSLRSTTGGPAAVGALRLAPHVPRVQRDATSVQFGASSTGVVLEGLDAADLRVLDLLDRGASLATVESDSRRRGSDPDRARVLLGVLDGHGLLVPAAQTGAAHAVRVRAERWSWTVLGSGERARQAGQRRRRGVAVHGGGGLAVSLAAGFAGAGVGSLAITDRTALTVADILPGGATADDVGGFPAAAAARAVRRAGASAVVRASDPPTRGSSPGSRPAVDLGVVVARHAADAALSSPWLTADVPHLPVVVRDGDIVVGPVVIPGRGPCLHCLDLTRRDRDPAWPAVLAQLLAGSGGQGSIPVVPALAAVATGVAVLLGCWVLDSPADPVLPGWAATVSLPLGDVAWRHWHPHPECGCAGATMQE